jgi:hypothetical protein
VNYFRSFVCFAAAALAGCLAPAPAPRTYTAVIDRVDRVPGEFYSPREGPKPLVCLYLRVAAPSKDERGELVRVYLMDLYSPELHGQRGDPVAFSYAHRLPISGELNFESLKNYRVGPKAELTGTQR